MPNCSNVGVSNSFVMFSMAAKNFSLASLSLSFAVATPIFLPNTAKRSYAPSKAKRKHSFISIALERPCATWNNAPIGLLIP